MKPIQSSLSSLSYVPIRASRSVYADAQPRMQDSYEDVIFATTTINEATKHNDKIQSKIWLPIDESGDDPDEPAEPIGLKDF